MSRAAAPGSSGRGTLIAAAGAYLVFVVYGSLVPLDFHPRPLALAWRIFLRTPYLALGMASRADWVANVVLYIPLAYLFAAAFAAQARSVVSRLLRIVAVFASCAAIAVGIEFAQLFFPPRTVSLNDIYAEWIGTAIGLAVWLVWGSAIGALWTRIQRGGKPALHAAVFVYVLAYLAFGLFPYDFVVSMQELLDKVASGGHGLIVAPGTCGRFSGCAVKFVAETMAVVPLGVLLSIMLGRRRQSAYGIAALSGLALGAGLELAQLVLASGVSEGMSALTRVAGVLLGMALHRNVELEGFTRALPKLGPAVLVATPVYVLALMWANAWFSAGWAGTWQAHGKLGEIRWLPFYYHYYTSETHALRSLLATLTMYVPVGFGYWLLTMRASAVERSALVPALLAAALASAMETGKLFVPGKHPDPTDILIAMAAAAVGFKLAAQMHRWALQGEPVAPSAAELQADAAAATAHPGPRWIPALLLLAAIAVVCWGYPLDRASLAAALVVYAALLSRYPGAALAAVLALLPLLDLSPWSGWVLVNEFDLVVAMTLVVRLLQPRAVAAPMRSLRGLRWVALALAGAFFASAWVGALPLSPFDANALGSYYTSFNSVRELKGFAWALALLPLLIDESRDPQRMERRVIAGMLIGLAAVAAVIVWQRAAFAGIADMSVIYRVEGTFPELNTGGGDVHAYLVMAVPFVLAWMALRPTLLRLALGTLLFIVTSYALGVTFARGGYVGYAGAIFVAAAAFAIAGWRRGKWTVRGATVAALPALAGIAVIVPIALGPFMAARLAGTQIDASARARHWFGAIRMMDPSATTAFLGMGLGTFPRTALFADPNHASATFRFERERNNGFVRLGSGTPSYLDQRVPIEAGSDYALSLDVRSAHANAVLAVPLCEKSVQYSFRCRWMRFELSTPGRGWTHHEQTFNTGELGSGGWLLRRPTVLSLSNGRPGTVVDVDNVRLLDATGRDLVANGDFSQGGGRWHFSADDHLAWHIDNLWVHLYFELGWLGVFAFGIAVVAAFARLGAGVWDGDAFAAFVLAALSGFLLVGFSESLLDGPRVTTLFFLLLFLALLRPGRAPRRPHSIIGRSRAGTPAPDSV